MGDWKLLKGANDKDAEEDPTDGSADGKVALYNLATDLGEQKNLAAEHEKVEKDLEGMCADFDKKLTDIEAAMAVFDKK